MGFRDEEERVGVGARRKRGRAWRWRRGCEEVLERAKGREMVRRRRVVHERQREVRFEHAARPATIESQSVAV